MHILIADDEAPARVRLRSLLQELGDEYRVAGEASDGQAVLDACERQRIDLVLMDIRMPDMNGLQAAVQLSRMPRPPAVIFTTAYEEHALSAFDANAIDYLLKPIRLQRLHTALRKAGVMSMAQLAALAPAEQFLSVTFRGSLKRIAINDVLYLHADRKYVEVGHRDGLALIEESLKSLEERFPGYFLRIHRNALVALSALRELVKGADGQAWVVLEGSSQRLEVSRRHLPQVRRYLKGREDSPA